MKYKAFIFFLVMQTASSFSFAQDKISTIEADNTQNTYQRKLGFGTFPGYETANFPLVYRTCTNNGKKTNCSDPTPRDFSLGDDGLNNAATEIYDFVINQRFDKVNFGYRKAEMWIRSESINFSIPRINVFNGKGLKSDDFDAAALDWSTKNLGVIFGKLLNKTLLDRYKNMSAKEYATFASEKAKELSIPGKMIRALMNSAYGFFVYLDAPTGDLSVTKGTIKKIVNGVEVQVQAWTASSSVSGSGKLVVLRYNPEVSAFEPYNVILGESGSVSSSKSFDHAPSQKELDAFLADEYHKVVAKALAINLQYQLVSDIEFAIIDPVRSLDEDSNVETPRIGVMEDIRIDAPMAVMSKIDGIDIIKGYTKARKVSLNCEASSKDVSKFELIKGSVEIGDKVVAHPWTGFFITGGAGLLNYRVDSYNLPGGTTNNVTAGGQGVGAQGGVKMDLGYFFNKDSFSEVWLGLEGGVFSAGPDMMVDIEANMVKCFYILTGLYFEPNLFLGMVIVSDDEEITVNGVTGSPGFGSFSVIPALDVGFNINPVIEIVLSAGWNQPLMYSGTITDNDDSDNKIELSDVSGSGGFKALISLNYHFSKLGGFSRLFAKPSKICRQEAESSESQKK